jgi:eukaryotic-like serine/threonine-protein kinase
MSTPVPTTSQSIDPETPKYWAFLSYSHRDRKWGDWLHRALESYRVPKRIVGQPTRDGDRPRRLFPIFRDREELPASADLGSKINEALTQSRYLVVVCSRNSANSVWVNEEIKFFKKLGREDRVFGLIVDGEPNASAQKPGFRSEDECFPEALRHRVDSDGQLLPLRTEPLASDAREDKDGKTNAKLKLLAALLDVNFDALRQREQERKRRSLFRLTGLAFITALGMSLIALYAVDQERRAESARKNAEEILNYLLYQLRDKLQPIGHLDIIEEVQNKVETYYKNLGFSKQDPVALNNWAVLLQAEGDRLMLQGNLKAAKAKYEEDLKIEQQLVNQFPKDRNLLANLSVGVSRMGDVFQAQGDLSAAKEQYSAKLVILRKLLEDEPGENRLRRELALTYENIGHVLQAEGHFGDAKAQCRDALEIVRKLANQDPGDSEKQRDLAVCYENLGDILDAQSDLDGSRSQYVSAIDVTERLLNQNPGSAQLQRDLAVNDGKLGGILVQQRDFVGAKIRYTNALEITQKLADQDPSNSQWRRDLMISAGRLGDLSLSQGDFVAAKTQYTTSLQICERLAEKDPQNTEWQRDLSISYQKLGIVLASQSDLKGAEAALTNVLKIRQKLAGQDLTNGQWQHDLALAYKNLGIVLKGQGNTSEAETDFRASLKILTDLIHAHGEDPVWKADLDYVEGQLRE